MSHQRQGPLSRAVINRQSARRSHPDSLDQIIADPATRILLIDQGHVPAHVSDEKTMLALCAYADIDHDALPGIWIDLGTLPHEDPRTLTAPNSPEPQTNVLGLILTNTTRTAYSDIEGIALPDPRSQATPDAQWLSVRDIGHSLDDADVGLALSATGLAAWHEDHQHCPRCGTITEVTQSGWARLCPADGTTHFPRTDPAVIVAVTDPRGRLLLGHAAHWPAGRFSILAGFVEAGEFAEAAVRREVHEEVGVELDDVTYWGSQPWPFPRSLMLGFTATTRTEDLKADGIEVTEAHWFTPAELNVAVREGLVTLPMASSIARALIDAWLTGELMQ